MFLTHVFITAGSRYWQSGIFEVSKNETTEISSAPPTTMHIRNNAIKVTLPNELEGVSYIQVSIQNGKKLAFLALPFLSYVLNYVICVNFVICVKFYYIHFITIVF